MKTVGLIASLALFATPALAQCPPEHLQTAVDGNAQANALAKGADASAIAAALDASYQVCPLDPFVMLVDARSWTALATKTNDQAQLARFADMALTTLLASERQTDASVGGQRLATIQGSPRPIVIGTNMALIDTVVPVVLETERIIGRTLPANARPGQGASVQKCDSNIVSHARAAADYVTKADSAGAMNMLDRASAACAAGMWQGDHVRVHRAEALDAMAVRNPAAPGLLDRMLGAARETDGIGEGGRSGPLRWDRAAKGKFTSSLFKVASAAGWTMPVEQWFTPENVNKSWTAAAMGVALDKAWAEGQATGGDIRARSQPYRDLFVKAYAAAANSPEATRSMAKDTLYWAARRHAEGTFRGKGNEGLTPPPDFLWKSLHDPTAKRP